MSKRKPVAWLVECLIDGEWCPQFPPRRTEQAATFDAKSFRNVLPEHSRVAPLYAAPTPLTDEQIGLLTTDPRWLDMSTPGLALFARAIERAHGIGEP